MITKNELHILHHLGLGDHYVCKGIVVEKLKEYENIVVYSMPYNMESVIALYEDCNNRVKVQKLDDNKTYTWNVADNFIKELKSKNENIDVMKIGFRNIESHIGASFDDSFYIQSGISFEKKWENFSIDKKYYEEEPEIEEYAFVHQDINRNYKIDVSKISLTIKEPVGYSNALKYIPMIQRAAEIHCIDSSFLNLIDLLISKGIKFCSGSRKYYHYYSRNAKIGAQPHLKNEWNRFDKVPDNVIKNVIEIPKNKLLRLDNYYIKNNKKYIVNLGIVNENVGDRYNLPSMYFDFNYETFNLDIRRVNLGMEDINYFNIKNCHIIVGGGGLLWQFHSQMESIHKIRTGCLVGWGFGTNSHNKSEYDILPGYINFYDLIGIRDYNLNNIKYVPCVSCMNKIFDKKSDIKRNIGIYYHVDGVIDGKYESMNNYNDLIKVVDFISSCEVLITNTWHGAYWGNLLKKRVIIYKPFSSRFYYYKVKNPIINKMDDLTDEIINQCEIDNNFLDECREINIEYYNFVNKLF